MKRILVFIITIALVLPQAPAFADDIDPLERIAELEEQLKEKDERIAELENQVNVLISLMGQPTKGNEPEEEPTIESNTGTDEYTESDFIGTWYDVRTAQRLVVNGDKTFSHSFSALEQPGYWSIEDGIFDVRSSTIRNDLMVISTDGVISLENVEYKFMRWEDLPKEELSIGEIGKGTNLSIKLKQVSFVDSLPSKIEKSGTYKSYGNKIINPLDEGMVYAVISFDVINMSKNEIKIADFVDDEILDYKGFLYATYDKTAYFCVSGNSIAILEDNRGVDLGIPVQPLQTRSFDVLIECPKIVETDKESPLHVRFITMFELPVCYFDYTIR